MSRLVDPETHHQNEDPALRPRNIDEYVGQNEVIQNLKIYIQIVVGSMFSSKAYNVCV